MAESTILHLKQFPARLQSYMKHQFMDLQLTRLGYILCEVGAGESMYTCLQTGSYDPILHRIEKLKLSVSQKQALSAIAMEVVDDEIQALHDCKLPKNRDSMCNKGLYMFLPHLQRYSNWNLEWWARYEKAISTWSSESKPEPFSLLPLFKLQPRHVHYTWSQFEAFIRWTKREIDVDTEIVYGMESIDITDKERKQFKTVHPSKEWNAIMEKRLKQEYKDTKAGTKRKRDDEAFLDKVVCDSFERATLQGRMKMFARRWINFAQRCRLQREKQYAIVELMSRLFDLKHVKQRDRKYWKLVSFRTDGVQLSLTFATTSIPSAPNVESLVKAGYAIPQGERIDVLQAARGIYCLTEDRNDLLPLKDCDKKRVNIVPLDPGCVVTLQGGRIPLDQCSSTKNICDHFAENEDTALWNITGAEWKKGSGREKSEKHEGMIRTVNPLYDGAIKALKEKRKKTASKDTFETFCDTVFDHLKILTDELVTLTRSKVRWMRTRRTVSWLSRVADKVFNREKGHSKKHSENEPINVAFLGDGTFGHKKGHAPVPKKQLAKVLATKGLTVMLDEFYTSKQCPCGKSELVDNTTLHLTDIRPRRHKTSGNDGPCCVECSLGEEKMDRDVLAIANFVLCAAAALDDKTRPIHLCRPWRTLS